jgi:hypothetical protein
LPDVNAVAYTGGWFTNHWLIKYYICTIVYTPQILVEILILVGGLEHFSFSIIYGDNPPH